MMPVFTFTKQANLRLLGQELAAAGFLVVGLTQHHDTWELVVDLDESETKDPTDVVNAHIYVEDLHLNLGNAVTAIRLVYQQAHDEIAAAANLAELKLGLATLGDCLKKTGRLLAFVAGTVELDNAEYSTGELDLDK
jgi:hypothetical protein